MIPETIPAITDNGTEIIVLMISGEVPRESPRKTEKIVMAKTSSIDAPGTIIFGTSCFCPLPFFAFFSNFPLNTSYNGVGNEPFSIDENRRNKSTVGAVV